MQREVLLALLESEILPAEFFLTGGTALSVWYCHHRVSNDLDFFSRIPVDLGAIDFALARRWPGASHKVRQSAMLLTYMIQDTKLDIVIDPLSFDEERPAVVFETGQTMRLDTMRSIASNKLSAMTSRTEPKDFVDFFHIITRGFASDFGALVEDAKRKDATFDDPATAAYAIESNFRNIIDNHLPLPSMRMPLHIPEWKACMDEVTRALYAMQSGPGHDAH